MRKCDSHQGGVKGIKQECQLMERCDGHDHGGGVRECGKVRQLSGGVKGKDRYVTRWKIVMIMEEVNIGLGRCDSCQGV